MKFMARSLQLSKLTAARRNLHEQVMFSARAGA